MGGHTLTFTSGNSEHQKNDADLFGFELTDDEMTLLTELQHNRDQAVVMETKEIMPGVSMPKVLLGSGSRPQDAAGITKTWLENGFRGLDTALIYFDQKETMQAVADAGIAREEVFILTKIPGCLAADTSIDYDLSQLGTDYIDLLLVHLPIEVLPGDCARTWKKLEGYVNDGKIKAIGVSNFNAHQMEKILNVATVPIAVNQIKYNVFSHDEDIISFNDAHNITTMAYSPLNGWEHDSIFTDETITGIAAAHNVSASQVALRWIVQRGHTLTFTSGNSEHQKNDADLFGFELTDDEMTLLTELQHNRDQAAVMETKEIMP